MADYQAFVDSIADEVQAFKKRQAEATASEEAREAQSLQRWQQRRKEEELRQKTTSSWEANGKVINIFPSVAVLTSEQQMNMLVR